MTATNSRGVTSSPVVRRLLGIPGPDEEEAPFRLSLDAQGVLVLSGGLDRDSVGEFRAVLRTTDPSGTTVVDLSGLHFIDSSGLGCLLAHDDRMRRAGGRFVLRHPGPSLCRLFEVTGAAGRLCIVPSDGS